MNKEYFVSKLRSFFSMPSAWIVLGLTLVFLLGACEATPAPTSPIEPVAGQFENAVADIVDVQPTSTPTASPTPTPVSRVTSTTDTPTRTPTPTPSSSWAYSTSDENCNASELVKSMTIPDGTVFAPGEVFIKTWKFKNIGDCMWEEDYLIIFVEGDAMGGDTAYLDAPVLVHKRGDASVVLIAPDEEGTYAGAWQLADGYGYGFGDTAYVEIVVSEDVISKSRSASTATPTSTPTPTATVESVTETSTATPIPTCTPTPAVEPTEEQTAEPATEEAVEEPTVEPVETDAALSAFWRWVL